MFPFQGNGSGPIPDGSSVFPSFCDKKTVASPVFGRIAQWIERLTSDQDVVGSIPTVVAASFGISSKKTLVDANYPSPLKKMPKGTMGYWSSGMILRLGRRGSWFDSAVAPT